MSICDTCESHEANTRLLTNEGHEWICSSCYNKRMEKEYGVKLVDLPDTIYGTDYDGVKRSFKIIKRLDPSGLLLEAEEQVELGYQFAVYGERDSDQVELFDRLMKKVNQGISVRSIRNIQFPDGTSQEEIFDDQVVGRVEYDENSNGEAPLIIIDGKPYTWQQLGRMVDTFEGFQIQVKFISLTDDVE